MLKQTDDVTLNDPSAPTTKKKKKKRSHLKERSVCVMWVPVGGTLVHVH